MAHGSFDRARFDPVQRKLFLDLCLQEANNGGRWGRTLKPASWNKIIEELKRQTGKDFSQRQLKNLWDYLKRQYFSWCKFVKAMGHGFDVLTHRVDWPAERWNEYVKTHKDVKQFRHKPLQFTVELAALFDDILEIDSSSSLPPEEGKPNDYDESLKQSAKDPSENANDKDSRTPTPATSLSTSSPLSALNVRNDVEAQARGKRRRKENRENTSELRKGILAIVGNDAYARPTIKECVDSLNKMSTLAKADKLYYVALTAFCEKEEYRELWMCITDEDVRIGWLRSISPLLGVLKSL